MEQEPRTAILVLGSDAVSLAAEIAQRRADRVFWALCVDDVRCRSAGVVVITGRTPVIDLVDVRSHPDLAEVPVIVCSTRLGQAERRWQAHNVTLINEPNDVASRCSVLIDEILARSAQSAA
jgi:hypothetical protein